MELNYALLYDLVRKERAGSELQEINKNFYEEAEELLRQLQRTVSEELEEKTLLQLANTRKLVKELYDRREQKILLLAQNRARTASSLVDSPNLLARERKLFERINAVLTEARTGVTTTTIEKTKTRTVIETVQVKQTVQTTPPIPQPEETPREELSIENEETVTVRITKRVGAFVGPSMQTLGPYEENELVDLKAPVAAVLIRRGSAEKNE